MNRFNIPAKKISQAIGKAGKEIARDAFKTLLVKPGARIGQLASYGIGKLVGGKRGEQIKENAFKTQKVNLGRLGSYDIPGPGSGAAGYRQAAGDALKSASYLYTPGKLAGAAGKATFKTAIKQGAKSGATLGGMFGAGESLQSERFSTSKLLTDTLKGAALGGIGGAVLGGAGHGVSKLAGAAKQGKFSDPRILELRSKWKHLQQQKNKTTNKTLIKNLENAQKAIERRVSEIRSGGFTKNPFISEQSNPKELPPRKMPQAQPQGKSSPEVQKDLSYNYIEAHHSAGSRPAHIADSIKKLTQALKEAAPLRQQQEALYSKARSEKIGAMLDARSKTTGEEGFYKELGALKGELPKVEFESLRGKIAQADIDNIFNAVAQTKKLGEFEKVAARQGLVKMFGEAGGAVPTNSELALLNQVFPPETIQALVQHQSKLAKFHTAAEQLINLPRSVMASFDLSAPFRQGLFLIGKPKQFFSAFKSMFKQFGSEKAYQAVQDEIASRPTYTLMRESNLALTEVGSVLSKREEKFMSSWAEKIPLLGRVIHASGRAYTGFLNKLRADVFDSLLHKAATTGVKVTPEVTNSLAKFINSASGRGSLGALEPAAQALNGIFFSPRLMASRVNLLNPVYYMKLEPFARKEALKTMAQSGSVILTVVGMSKMAGADVGLDPRSADFLKIKVGNTRIDTLGGIQQYLRLAAQVASGQIISSTTGETLTLGEGYKPLTRLDIIGRFFQGKENPVASFVTDWLRGQDLIGNKFELGPAILDRFVPLLVQELRDTIKEQGFVKGGGLGIPAIFGAGVQTYSEKKPENKKTPTKSTQNRFNR